jgi:hypothetical protein
MPNAAAQLQRAPLDELNRHLQHMCRYRQQHGAMSDAQQCSNLAAASATR